MHVEESGLYELLKAAIKSTNNILDDIEQHIDNKVWLEGLGNEASHIANKTHALEILEALDDALTYLTYLED